MLSLIEILLIAAFGWLIVGGARRFRGGSGDLRRGPWDQQKENQTRPIAPGDPTERSVTVDFDARRRDDVGAPAALPAAPPIPPKVSREQQMSELKRRYVADEITVEEYEAELDKLIREPKNPQ